MKGWEGRKEGARREVNKEWMEGKKDDPTGHRLSSATVKFSYRGA